MLRSRHTVVETDQDRRTTFRAGQQGAFDASILRRRNNCLTRFDVRSFFDCTVRFGNPRLHQIRHRWRRGGPFACLGTYLTSVSCPWPTAGIITWPDALQPHTNVHSPGPRVRATSQSPMVSVVNALTKLPAPTSRSETEGSCLCSTRP